jgi:hypothetical protein
MASLRKLLHDFEVEVFLERLLLVQKTPLDIPNLLGVPQERGT